MTVRFFDGPVLDRLDPFWWHDELWYNGSFGTWAPREVIEKLVTVRPDGRTLRRPRRKFDPLPEALDLVIHSAQPTVQKVLAAIMMWRTVTSEQLVALTGFPERTIQRATGRLFDAGVIERGEFRALPPSRLPWMWRVRPGEHVDALLRRLPTYNRWVSITGGLMPNEGSRRQDRHNILAAELALRLAEHHHPDHIGTVLGERFAARRLLCPTVSKANTVKGGRDQGDPVFGDLVMIRDDGLRVLFEVTASDQKLTGKMIRWLEVLGSEPLNDLGLVVCFIEAGPPGEEAAWLNMLRSFEAVLESPDFYKLGLTAATRQRALEAFTFARWSTWFPAQHSVDATFDTLTVTRPIGRRPDDYDENQLPLEEWRWEPVSLRDMKFTPADSAAAYKVIERSQSMWGTPHWLRDERLAQTYALPALR